MTLTFLQEKNTEALWETSHKRIKHTKFDFQSVPVSAECYLWSEKVCCFPVDLGFFLGSGNCFILWLTGPLLLTVHDLTPTEFEEYFHLVCKGLGLPLGLIPLVPWIYGNQNLEDKENSNYAKVSNMMTCWLQVRSDQVLSYYYLLRTQSLSRWCQVSL